MTAAMSIFRVSSVFLYDFPDCFLLMSALPLAWIHAAKMATAGSSLTSIPYLSYAAEKNNSHISMA